MADISDIDVYVPEKLLPVIDNLYTHKHSKVVLWGGRGSSKTQTMGLCILLASYTSDGTILVAREIQKSIKDSLHSTLAKMITDLGLDEDFHVINTGIVNLSSGANITFRGLQANISSIKGIANLEKCFVDEAESVTENSWNVLQPTLRYGNTLLMLSFNPRFPTDPTWKMFVETPYENSLVIEINWYDNAMFPDSLNQLRQEMYNKCLKENNLSLYYHIWEGKMLSLSNSSILGAILKQEPFEVDSTFGSPYLGLDFGFSNDPNVIVECYVKGRNLYINKVGLAHQLPLNRTASWLIDHVPNVQHYPTYADCARPETIHHLNSEGLTKVKGCTKGKIVDGVNYLQGFDSIILNSRACANQDMQHKVYEQLLGYKYKVLNEGTPHEVITPDIKDASNDVADAIRYSLQPLIIKKKNSFSMAV